MISFNNCKFLIAVFFVILLFLLGCTNNKYSKDNHLDKYSKDNHTVIFVLNDSLFVEKYTVYKSKHATTTDSYAYYITDSIYFRKFVGILLDVCSERMLWEINDSNDAVFYLVSEKFPVGAIEAMDSIEKTEKDPEKIIEKRRAILKYVYDTTEIGRYNIQELIKEGKFE